MPGFRMPATPIAGLREMSADDIRHALSDVHVPDINLADIDPRKVELPESLRRLDLSRLDLSRIDLTRLAVPAAVASVAMNVAERLRLRRKRRSRAPFVIAAIAMAVAGVIIVRNLDWIRARAGDLGSRIRRRQDADRVDAALEPIGGNGAYTDDMAAIPIEPEAYGSPLPSDEPAFPTASEELEAEIADRIPAAGETAPSTESGTSAESESRPQA